MTGIRDGHEGVATVQVESAGDGALPRRAAAAAVDQKSVYRTYNIMHTLFFLVVRTFVLPLGFPEKRRGPGTGLGRSGIDSVHHFI